MMLLELQTIKCAWRAAVFWLALSPPSKRVVGLIPNGFVHGLRVPLWAGSSLESV